MKHILWLTLLAGVLFACNNTEESGYHPDAEALQIEALKVYHRKPDSALSILDKGVQMDPSFYLLYNTKAMVFMDKGQWNRAIAELHKSLSWQPDQAEVHLQLGMLNDMIGMPEKAGDLYEQAIALYDSRLAQSGSYEIQDRANRAIAFIMKGEQDKGNKILDGLIDKHPDNRFISDLAKRLEAKPDSISADREFYLQSLIGKSDK